MSAGIAVLEALADGEVFAKLGRLAKRWQTGWPCRQSAGVTVLQRIGSMSCCYFADGPVHNMGDAMGSDREKFGGHFHGMLQEGSIWRHPSLRPVSFR